MMSPFTNEEISEIVRQVVGRLHGEVESPALAGRIVQKTFSPAMKVDMGDNVSAQQKKVVAIGADHGGYELKARLILLLQELEYEVIDCGTHDKTSVDYPDFAYSVAELVSQGSAWRGIVIDGAGIGSCMAANKVPGVRAAMCYDYATAVNSREHNDANVLTLGAGLIGDQLARQIVRTWLATDFAGGRHQPRIHKIEAIEKKFTRNEK